MADPAERQVAVECIVVIARIEERNPLIKLNSGTIDLLKIIKEAVKGFWQKLLESNPNLLDQSGANNTGEAINDTLKPLPVKENASNTLSAPSPSKGSSASPAVKRPNHRASIPDSAAATYSHLRTTLEHQNIPVALDKSFEKNERLARVLFFDLPSEGKEGTLSFLAAACVKLVFDVQWTNDSIE